MTHAPDAEGPRRPGGDPPAGPALDVTAKGRAVPRQFPGSFGAHNKRPRCGPRPAGRGASTRSPKSLRRRWGAGGLARSPGRQLHRSRGAGPSQRAGDATRPGMGPRPAGGAAVGRWPDPATLTVTTTLFAAMCVALTGPMWLHPSTRRRTGTRAGGLPGPVVHGRPVHAPRVWPQPGVGCLWEDRLDAVGHGGRDGQAICWWGCGC
jgi:hypothetical protein